MACNCNTPNVNQTFIIEQVEGTPVLSACTSLFTDMVKSCSGDTTITMGTGVVTFNGNVDGINSLTANTIEANTYLSGGTNILDVINGNDTYITNAILTGATLDLNRNDNVTLSVDLNPLISGKTDLTLFEAYTGATETILDSKIEDGVNFGGANEIFSGKSGNDLYFRTISGGSNTTLSTVGNVVKIDVNIPPDANTFVTGTSLNNTTYTINQNDGSSFPTDFEPLISGKVETTLFNTYTGDTETILGSKLDTTIFNTYSGSVQTDLDGKVDTTLFNTYSGDVETTLSTKISGATNLSAEGVFAQKNGLDLEFKGITSTGGTVNISSNSTSVNLEVTIPPDQDKFVSGGTYNTGTQEIDFIGNSVETTFGVGLSSLINSVSGDTFVSGGTLSNTDLILEKNNGVNVNPIDLSGLISGKTDLSLFNTHTGDTGNPHETSFGNLISTAHTHTLSEITDFNSYSGNVQTQIDTKTDIPLFNSHTGDTNNPHQTSFSSLTSTAHTHTINDVINLQTELDGKLNVSEFNTYSGDVQTQIDDKLETSIFNSYTGSVVDVFVSSGNANSVTQQLSFTNTTGGTFNVTNSAALFSDNDVNVTGGTYNPSNGCVTFVTNSGTTFDVCGFVTGITDTFVTGGTLSGTDLILERSSGVDVSGIDLSSLVSGKLDITVFNTYTGDTETILNSKTDNTDFTSHTGDTTIHYTKSSINLSDLGSSAHTHTLSEITDFNSYSGNVQTQLNTKIDNGVNSGGANEVFSGKSGTDLYFRTISGGSNTTITTVGGIIKIDSTSSGDNTFVTGGTYSSGTLTLDRNDGDTVTVTGFTTGGGDNFYVTGFTYNDANTLTISQNGGLGDLTSTINNVTGLTVNGTLVVDTISATTINGSVSGLTLNDLDDVISNIPTTPDNTYQGRLLYFDVTDNQWVTGEEYVSTGNVTIWAKKGTAGTIDKGCPVYITGFDDDIHEVELANATTASTMPVIGFTGEDFDNAGVYPLITFGKLVGVDTTSTVSTINPNGETWAVNDVLYMNTTDGGLTKFRPPGTNTQIQRIAKVLKVDSNSGQLFIFNTARTAGLPNLTTDYLWLGNGNDTPQEVIRTDVGITTTGFTYNDNNTFTITDDNGGSFSSTINQMSGLTINGDLDVTGNTVISGTLNIGSVGGTTPVTNLGVDSNGNVVSGTTGGGTGVSDANKLFSWFMNVT